MSTNFYADWQIAPGIIHTIHIGKRNGECISTFSGTTFPTLAALRAFLRHHKESITITSEYGVAYDLEEFLKEEVDHPAGASVSGVSIQWLKDRAYKVHDLPVPISEGKTHYWVDEGRLFYSGEFC